MVLNHDSNKIVTRFITSHPRKSLNKYQIICLQAQNDRQK